MPKRYTVVALTGLAAILVVLVFSRTSEEQKILLQLEELRILAQMRSPESAIAQVSRAKQIGTFFSEQTKFDLSSAGYGVIEIPGRHELVQRTARGRARLASLELVLEQPQVSIEGDHATVEVRGTALGSIKGEQGQFLDIHLVEVILRKKDDAWLVTGARHLRDEREQVRATP